MRTSGEWLAVLAELGVEERDCAVCREVTAFEVPPCLDGHGDACPERICTACDSAVLVDLGRGGAGRRQRPVRSRSGSTGRTPGPARPRHLAVVA